MTYLYFLKDVAGLPIAIEAYMCMLVPPRSSYTTENPFLQHWNRMHQRQEETPIYLILFPYSGTLVAS